MSRSWNVVNGLREVDHLSGVERMISIRRVKATRSTFFGAPEYIIFPTMITSVFDHKSRRVSSLFAPAKPALLQTCDLICWLLVVGAYPEPIASSYAEFSTSWRTLHSGGKAT